MASFKRKNFAKKATVSYPGTRPSSSLNSSSTITSTGISSLDDLLGGGLPLSCLMIIVAPDFHSSYGELVQKYLIAEGLACGHDLCVIDNDPLSFVEETPWFSKPERQGAENVNNVEDGEVKTEQKVKIAWRYEQMKQFQTTVQTSSSSSEDFCHNFDLSNHIPKYLIDEAFRTQLYLLATKDLISSANESPSTNALLHIEKQLQQDNSVPLRVCIPSLGSPLCWGDMTSQSLLYFLHSLKRLLRRYPHGCASVTLAPHVSPEGWGSVGWLQKVGWVSDASVTLAAFSADPSLSAAFSSHHGLVNILSLPSPNTLVPPSDRFSTLRGLAASSSSSGGSSENNLAFKCTRKRLIFETLHLDLEGGVTERRTSVPSTAVEPSSSSKNTIMDHSRHEEQVDFTAARIDIQFEDSELQKQVNKVTESGAKKTKKRVAFFPDRPELYAF